MIVKGEITFRYKTSGSANVAYDSLEVDNGDYLESRLEGNSIKYNIESEKLGSFLATVDDLIASEIVVEKIVTKTGP